MRTSASTQQGQTIVIFALVLGLFFVGMIALVADVGKVFVDYNRADDAALLAAQAGASAIDVDAVRAGTLVLDPEAARARCLDSIQRSGLTGDCSATAQAVTARLQEAVSLPIPVAGFNAQIRTSRTAVPAFGGTTANP